MGKSERGKGERKHIFQEVDELDPFALGGRCGIYILHDGTIYRLEDKPFYRSYKGEICVSVHKVPLTVDEYQRISPIDLPSLLGGSITFRKKEIHQVQCQGEGPSERDLYVFLGRCEKKV